MGKEQIKVGLNAGGGMEPGYSWSVWVLDAAYRDIRKRFSQEQYLHLVDQMKVLAQEAQPSHSVMLSIDQIEDFHELREIGGLMGNCNARIFFAIDGPEKAIVVLGGICKQNSGPTPLGDKVTCRNRYRKYRRGEFDKPK